MKKAIIISLLSLATLAITSCEKVVTNTTYTIVCTQSGDSIQAVKLSTDVVGYSFYGDTADYAPKSYAQALSGKISNRKSSGEISKYSTAKFDVNSATISFNNMNKEGKVIFVLCDKTNQIYSYRQFEVVANLPAINTSLLFKTEAFEADSSAVINVSSWIQKK